MLKVFFLIFIFELFILLIFTLIKNYIIKYKIDKALLHMKHFNKLINTNEDEEIKEAEKIIDSYRKE